MFLIVFKWKYSLFNYFLDTLHKATHTHSSGGFFYRSAGWSITAVHWLLVSCAFMATTEVLDWPPITATETIQKLIAADTLKLCILSLPLNEYMLMFACHCPNAHSKVKLLRLHLSLASTVRGLYVSEDRVGIHLWHVCPQPQEMRLAKYCLPPSYWT